MLGTEGAAKASGAPGGRAEDDDYRPALDGLRAVAVIAVVLFHLDRLPGGNLGVDAFFVLSGWLITTRLLSQADRSPDGRIDLGGFWSARVRRLLPASLAVILVVAVAWSAAGITVASLRHDALWALGFASNWGTVVAGGDYWARFGEPSPLTHLWSLAVEEQIYLLWPLVLYAVIRRGRPQRGLLVAATSLALAGASIAWMVTSYDPLAPTSTYVDTFARAHSLLIGAAAAGVTSTVRGRRLAARLGRHAMRPAVYLLVGIVTVASADADWLYAWGFPLFAVAMAVVVVAASEGVGAPVLASRPLRWLGQRSYGVYLWHWPAILFLSGSRTPLSGAALDTLRVVVALAIAAASYRWLELPIRRRPVLTVRW
ncbi:MAG: acyltransferase, partial [Acidimicrobiales bacterium]